MRRVAAGVLAALAVLPAVASAAATEVRDAPWRLLGVGADGRSLQLDYAGGCGPDDARAVVVETGETISLLVRKSVVVDAPCPAILQFVGLDVPLAGAGPREAPTSVR